jgi:TolB-like protein/cytochrome c-type biogenesis protein CcmH/NrfG
LPDWTPTLVIVLLAIGFPIVIIFSWIYDIHPEEGMVKTEPAEKAKAEDIPKSSNGWKIASYISFVVIVGLIALNVFGRRNRPRIDESLAKSIAVLPFHNLSGDAGQEYLCEGITDEIISNLYKTRSFDKVASFTSVMSFKDTDRNIQKIAEELGVNYILEGSYKRMGEHMKITAQLIEPMSDNHIWLEDYELPYSEIMGIPGDIALQIAGQINVFLSDEAQKQIAESGTTSLRAFEIVQDAYYHFFHWDFSYAYEDSLLKAIELDPEYADAYAGMGWLYITGESFLPLFTEDETDIWQAQSYLEKAIELDPDNLLANLNLGCFNLWIKWDYIAAEQYFEKALQLTRDHPLLIARYSEFLVQMNRLEEYLSFCESTDGCVRLLRVLILLGRESEARDLFAERMQESDIPIGPQVGETCIYLHQYDSAVHYFELCAENNHPQIEVPRYKADMAIAYHQTGNAEKANALLAGLRDMSNESARGSPDYFLGKYYSWVNNVDSAFFFLEKAYRNRSSEMPWLKVNPAFNSLKDDDRYWDLYERTGHKAYDDYLARK